MTDIAIRDDLSLAQIPELAELAKRFPGIAAGIKRADDAFAPIDSFDELEPNTFDALPEDRHAATSAAEIRRSAAERVATLLEVEDVAAAPGACPWAVFCWVFREGGKGLRFIAIYL